MSPIPGRATRLLGACFLAMAGVVARAGDVDDTDAPLHPFQEPSLCVVVADECHVPGARVRATVELGYGDATVIGGHLRLNFDPAVLELFSISPGSTCDPSSPFTSVIVAEVDPLTGEITYAVDIDPSGSTPGTTGPATMACLEFVLLDQTESSLCLIEGVNPSVTQLVDEFGHRVLIDNAFACPPPDPLTTLACAEIAAAEGCTCPTGVPDCSLLDNDCNTGICNEDIVECEALPINEGGVCDDGDACTDVDTCVEGVCVGTGCANPSLCVASGGECDDTGRRTMAIVLGEGDRDVVGAQFSIVYNPAALRLINISPGSTCDPSSPFEIEMAENIDRAAGEIFYAVGVNPFGGPAGTHESATLACLEFQLIGLPRGHDVCLFHNVNPRSTLIVDITGHTVGVHNSEDCPTDARPPAFACDDVCMPVPVVSEWGLIIMTLLLLTVAKVSFSLRRPDLVPE